MTKQEELDLFIERADELLDSKYIIADIKIVNLLKAIAQSETFVALFKSCLQDFNYEEAKSKYLVKSPYLAEDKGEFVLPSATRDLLAFVFNILMDIDDKSIVLADFIAKYFYEDGSLFASFSAFLNSMIRPFKNSVVMLMQSVIEGKLEDPIMAVTKEEERKEKEKQEAIEKEKREKELSAKGLASNIDKAKQILLAIKTKIKDKQYSRQKEDDMLLIVDMLGTVMDSNDIDAINYAFTAFKFMAKCHKILFIGKIDKLEKLIGEIKSGI